MKFFLFPLICFSFSIIIGWQFHLFAGVSFALGGMITLIPTFLFAKIFLKPRGARAAKKIVHTFFIGEAVKWVATILLFVLAFQWKELQVIFLFAGFIVAQLTYWISIPRHC